jgi:hypothetical protein
MQSLSYNNNKMDISYTHFQAKHAQCANPLTIKTITLQLGVKNNDKHDLKHPAKLFFTLFVNVHKIRYIFYLQTKTLGTASLPLYTIANTEHNINLITHAN